MNSEASQSIGYDPKNGFFLCFVGLAGAGKGTVTRSLLASYPDELTLAISATSRASRPGEKEGKHYFFLERDAFMAEVQGGAFFEWEETHGNLYGTPQRWIDEVMNEGGRVLLDIDIRGAVNFSSSFPEHFCGVLVLPPSIKELIERIQARGGVSDEELAVRLKTAERELTDYQEGLKKGALQHVLINDHRERVCQEAAEIFLGNRVPSIENIDEGMLRIASLREALDGRRKE